MKIYIVKAPHKIKLVSFLNLVDEDWWTLYERNKELRRENEQLKQSQKQLAISELKEKNKVDGFWHSAYQGKQLEYDQVYAELRKSYEENQQLKQSQKQLAIEELEKVKEKFGYKHNTQLVVSSRYLCEFIDNQIKELKGE